MNTADLEYSNTNGTEEDFKRLCQHTIPPSYCIATRASFNPLSRHHRLGKERTVYSSRGYACAPRSLLSPSTEMSRNKSVSRALDLSRHERLWSCTPIRAAAPSPTSANSHRVVSPFTHPAHAPDTVLRALLASAGHQLSWFRSRS